MIEVALKALGLNTKEQEVYLANVELGSALVQTIAERAKLNRTSTYDILKELERKGFVSYTFLSKKRWYQATEPQKLIGIVKEKETLLKKALPELNELKKRVPKKPTVEVYLGKQGIKAMLEDILNSSKEFASIASKKGLVKLLKYYFPNFVERRKKLGIQVRLIVDSIPIDTEADYKIISQEIETATWYYAGKIATISLEEKEPVGILIEEKNFYETSMVVFDLLWNTLPNNKNKKLQSQNSKLIVPKRSPKSHKGQNGVALTIGGSADYVGCVTLAALAALRTGCDLSYVCAPEKVAWAINAHSPELITKKCKGKFLANTNEKEIQPFLNKASAFLIGNGIGSNVKTKQLVQKIIQSNKPKVIDADALHYIKLKKIKNAILTPHKKELFELLKNNLTKKEFEKCITTRQSKKKEEANSTQISLNAITFKTIQKHLNTNALIVKGKIDYIITKNSIDKNTTGNEGMTKGGTGDVLAGIALGYLAQGMKPKDAAKNATYLNGKIADELKKKKGYTYLASDIIEEMKKIKK